MNKGLEALKETAIQIVEALYGKEEPLRNDKINALLNTKQFEIIEKELKDYYKIKARLSIITMKIKSKIKECNDNIIHTNEEDFMNVASEIELQTITWFNDLLKEALL